MLSQGFDAGGRSSAFSCFWDLFQDHWVERKSLLEDFFFHLETKEIKCILFLQRKNRVWYLLFLGEVARSEDGGGPLLPSTAELPLCPRSGSCFGRASGRNGCLLQEKHNHDAHRQECCQMGKKRAERWDPGAAGSAKVFLESR